MFFDSISEQNYICYRNFKRCIWCFYMFLYLDFTKSLMQHKFNCGILLSFKMWSAVAILYQCSEEQMTKTFYMGASTFHYTLCFTDDRTFHAKFVLFSMVGATLVLLVGVILGLFAQIKSQKFILLIAAPFSTTAGVLLCFYIFIANFLHIKT